MSINTETYATVSLTGPFSLVKMAELIVVDNLLYLVGGVYVNGDTANAKVLKMDTESGEWSDVTEFGLLPTADPGPYAAGTLVHVPGDFMSC